MKNQFPLPESNYIWQLIAQGEHQHLDFKYVISNAKKIARSFSAFANTEGGKLLIGVKDNGVVTGIKTDEEAHMIESASQLFCKPPVEYTIRPWKVDGKQILEVSIAESNDKPHLAPWKEDLWRAFVRVNDENFIANSIQVAVWKKQRSESPVLVKYSKTENELLTYLQQHKTVDFKTFRKVCRVSYPIAKKVLTNLLAIGILDIIHTENTAYYILAEESTDDNT